MDANDIAREISVVLEEALANESEVIKSLQRAMTDFDAEEEGYDGDLDT